MSNTREPPGLDSSTSNTPGGSNGKSLNPFEDDNPQVATGQISLSKAENRVYKTVCIYAAFFSLGLVHNMFGPTLVQMELYFNTDTKTIALVFTCFSVGYIIGSSLCGILFDRLNQELTFTTACFLGAILACIAPFVGGLYGYIGILGSVGIFQGFVDAGGSSYTVCLWEGSRWKEPLLQGVHMIWSVGGAVGPLITKPFLVHLHLEVDNTTRCYEGVSNSSHLLTTTTPVTGSPPSMSNISNMATPQYRIATEGNGTTSPDTLTENLAFARYAYVTVGCIAIIPAILFLVAYIGNGPTLLIKKRRHTNKKQERENEQLEAQSRKFILTMLILMFIFYMFYLVLEVSPGNFLASFAIKELCWQNHHGALITSLLWASHGIGRLIGVPISAFISPKVMLITNSTLQVLAYATMCFVHFHYSILWISTALLGLGMATTFATGILWASQYIKITGLSSAIFSFGASVGSMSSPILVGHMFEQYTPMWLVYIGLSAAVFQYAVFIATDLFARRNFKAKPVNKDTKLDSNEEMEPLELQRHYNF